MVYGEHMCALYESDADHRAVVSRFLRDGLERNEKILYIIDANSAERIRSYADVGKAEAEGRVVFLGRDESYTKDGVFDPDRMIATLRKATADALAEGYAGLRVTGEMTWALRGLPGSERLLEYEAKLNRFFPGSKCLAICQYDMRRFTPRQLMDVLRAHPEATVGRESFDNFYYMPPDELLSERRDEAELRAWIRNLALHHEMTERLRARTAQLEAANRELADFAHSASHDLRSPLRAINGYAGLLAKHESSLDEQGRTFLDAIIGATRRMDAVVTALLALGSIGQRELARRRVDLSQTAREVVEELRRGDPDRQVEVRIQDHLYENADPVLTRLVLQNLIGNAWKFTSERPDARIELGRLPGSLEYFVRDNGAGFDPAFSDKLFKPFRRLHSGARFAGNGIGLASVHRAVGRHGGAVWAEGVPEKGATFWFRLQP